MDDLMIKIDNVSKMYKLGQIGGTTIREELQRTFARIRGKEDPTKKIGAKDYNKGETFMALNGVSFDVKKGERIGIIGHNGAGKSTLLKLLSRVTAPTSGEIGLNGRVTSMLEVGTGFHGELTGRENIYMNGAILGMTKKEIDAKMEDIIEFSECRKFIDTPVKRYSSGMYVKLAFSVAAHLDSEIMIMDEVLAVGDMAFQKKCLDKMNDVSKKEGRTILYVSHNMNTIRQLCERVIVLDHGKVVFDGDVEEGIEIYSKANGSVSLSYDYSDYYRSPNESRKLQMLGTDIINTESVRTQRGNFIEFVIHCIANEDFENLQLRFEIFSAGNIQGTSFLNQKINGKAGEKIDLHCKLNTTNFVPAKYTAVALIFDTDGHGDQVGVDRVEPAMIFEIIDEEKDSLVWIPHYWGYTRYDDIVLQEKHLL